MRLGTGKNLWKYVKKKKEAEIEQRLKREQRLGKSVKENKNMMNGAKQLGRRGSIW